MRDGTHNESTGIQPSPLTRRTSAVAILLATLAVGSAFISPISRDLIFGDESRYARIAAEMAARGSWLIPSLDGEPYTDKPPLHFDAILAIGRWLGFQRTWTFVLPSLLSFAALTLLVGAAASRWIGRGGGGLAAFLFATFLFPWGSAQTARMDLEYALLTTLALVLLYESMAGGKRALLLASGAAVGTAILVKGPAVAAIALLIWIAESVRRRRRPGWIDGAALLVAAAIPAAWISVIAARGGAWVAFDLVVTQNLGRAVDSFSHPKPFWFFLERFPALFFPWFVLLLFALVGLRRRRSEAATFCAIWFASILLFFSAISGKLEVYLLPAAAPAAILIAAWARGASDRESRRAWAVNAGLLAVMAAVLLAAPILAARAEPTPELELLLGSRFPLVARIAGATAALGALLHALPRVRAAIPSILVSGPAFMTGPVAVVVLMMGLANEVYSSQPLIRQIRMHGFEGASLVFYEGFHPWGRDFAFADVEQIREADPWTLKKAQRLPAVVVTRSSRATELGTPLRTDYDRIASIRIRRKDYDIYRLRPGAPPSERQQP